MNFLKKILIVFILFLNPSYTLNNNKCVSMDYPYLLEQQEKILYPLKHGKPTSRGIDYYVKINKYDFIKEFENHIKDTLMLDVEISTDNLEQYQGYDTLDLAYHFTYENGTDEIVIDNRESFLAYDINDLSKFKKLNLSSNNAFVKTSVMHELAHSYFLQIIIEAKFDSLQVYKEYDFRNRMMVKMFPNAEDAYGAEFIEEGVCQYLITEMKLQIPSRPFVPQTISDILDKKNEAQIKYGYSVEYLQEFLDFMGLKQGIRILVTNKPPRYDEILNPKKYYDRLK
jgi:hypothetical protein